MTIRKQTSDSEAPKVMEREHWKDRNEPVQENLWTVVHIDSWVRQKATRKQEQNLPFPPWISEAAT